MFCFPSSFGWQFFNFNAYRASQVERLKSQIFILSCTQRRYISNSCVLLSFPSSLKVFWTVCSVLGNEDYLSTWFNLHEYYGLFVFSTWLHSLTVFGITLKTLLYIITVIVLWIVCGFCFLICYISRIYIWEVVPM